MSERNRIPSSSQQISDLAVALGEGVAVLMMFELGGGQDRHPAGSLVLIGENADFADGGRRLPRLFCFLLAPILEKQNLEFPAAAENHPVRGIADIKLRIFVFFGDRIEPRVGIEGVAGRVLEDDLAQ